MAFSIIVTLTTAGSNTGPFDLYSDVDSYTTPFETNVTKLSLLGGYYCSNTVPDGTTTIQVKSTDACTNSTFISISGLPSPSPSPTPSVTPTISITPSITPSEAPAPSITPTSTVTPTITPTSSETPIASVAVSVTPSVTPSETPSSTPSTTPSVTITPSTTPSVTITPSVTRTPSITPSLPNYTITVQGQEQSPGEYTGTLPVYAYYSTNGGVSWTSIGSAVLSAGGPTTFGSFSVLSGTNVNLALDIGPGNNIVFGEGFGSYTGYCGKSSSYSFTVSTTQTKTLNPSVVFDGFNNVYDNC